MDTEGKMELSEKTEQSTSTESPVSDTVVKEVVQPAEFTSEIFKVEIKNLPKNIGFGALKKFVASLDLNVIKVKSPGNCTYAFVTFSCEEQRQNALKVLNGATLKGRTLTACYAKATIDPVKRKNEEKLQNNKSARSDKNEMVVEEKDDRTPEEKVQAATTPLWQLPYSEQCEQKKSNIKQILRKTFFKMERLNKDTYYWLQKQSKDFEGMCCDLSEFIPSPIIDNYRNKCEFTIGYDETETEIKIGFRVGVYKSGSNVVVEPYVCRNISEHMKSFVKIFRDYLDESLYKPCNLRLKTGNWRQLTLRSNEVKDLLAIIVFDQKDLTAEEIQKEKDQLSVFLKNKFECLEYSDFKLKSFLFNLNTNRTGISSFDNLECLYGEQYLNENLLGLNFRVSPLAFFQSNTKGAEVLYSKIGDICNIDKETVVLDICCGTGTIGLTLASKAKLVVGVEIIPEAIEDAKLNSEINDIKNVEWHCGKAEEILPNLLKRFHNEKVIAIIDPPRAGLHTKVLQYLRNLKNLNNLVYVSCNPELAMQNFVDLARDTSKNYTNQPFVPVRAIAVDMFPHTAHCELILYFTRYSNELFKSYNAIGSTDQREVTGEDKTKIE